MSLFQNKGGSGSNRDTFKNNNRELNSIDRFNSLDNPNESVRLLRNNESNYNSGDEE